MRRSIGQEEHMALRRRLDNVTEGVPDAAQLRLVAGLADEHPTRFGSYSLPTESGGKLGPSTATLIRSASAIPRTCSATSRGRCSRTPPTSSGSSLTFLSRLMGLPMGSSSSTSTASPSGTPASGWVGGSSRSGAPGTYGSTPSTRSEEHTSELQSQSNLVC